jgi:hypothetical protein
MNDHMILIQMSRPFVLQDIKIFLVDELCGNNFENVLDTNKDKKRGQKSATTKLVDLIKIYHSIC